MSRADRRLERRCRKIRRRSFVFGDRAVRGRLGVLLGGVPSELGGQQRGDVGGRGGGRIAGQQACPCPPAQHVVDRARHLVTGGVHDLGLEIGKTRDGGGAQRGIVIGEGGHRAG